jgi:hypothetical protein
VGTLTLEGGGGLLTVTVAELTAGVPPLLAVAVYVVVSEGFTVSGAVVELFGATAPIPLSIVTDVALVDVHVSIDEPPDAMDAGVAVNWIVGAAGGGAEVTVIVVELFALALALLAVAV